MTQELLTGNSALKQGLQPRVFGFGLGNELELENQRLRQVIKELSRINELKLENQRLRQEVEELSLELDEIPYS
ncbi:MAG: hypothetical protein NT917_09510 [Microcystis aeruginosa WS75]|nr:hypothetical protein [Microcystis aeruginosa WS75]